jgi:hypothetical protein
VIVVFDVAVDERDELVLADLVLVPKLLVEIVGVAVLVLEGNMLLDMEEDPVEVLELVILLVSVELIRDVDDPLGEREAEAEAVDVLEGRTDIVCVDEPVCVLD